MSKHKKKKRKESPVKENIFECINLERELKFTNIFRLQNKDNKNKET